MYILDTDIIIWLLRNDSTITKIIDRIRLHGGLGVSTLTIAEVYQNIFPNEISHAEALFLGLDVFEVSANIAKEGGYYWQRYSKNLKNLSIADCLIAATAKVYHRKLLTLNTKHYQMTDIEVLNPLNIK